MFFRSNFRSIEKADIKSKRNEGRQTGEEPAVAKPRPTCLYSRNLLNVRHASSLDSGASNAPENPQLDSNSVHKSTGKHVQGRDQHPAANSQEWHQDNPCPGSTWKHEQSDVCVGSSWKHVQGIENHLFPQHANLWLSIRWQSLREPSTEIMSGLMYWMSNDLSHVYVNENESISSSWAELQWKSGGVQKHRFQGAQDIVRHHSKIDLGTIHDCVESHSCWRVVLKPRVRCWTLCVPLGQRMRIASCGSKLSRILNLDSKQFLIQTRNLEKFKSALVSNRIRCCLTLRAPKIMRRAGLCGRPKLSCAGKHVAIGSVVLPYGSRSNQGPDACERSFSQRVDSGRRSVCSGLDSVVAHNHKALVESVCWWRICECLYRQRRNSEQQTLSCVSLWLSLLPDCLLQRPSTWPTAGRLEGRVHMAVLASVHCNRDRGLEAVTEVSYQWSPSRKKDDDASAVLLMRMPATMAVCDFASRMLYTKAIHGLFHEKHYFSACCRACLVNFWKCFWKSVCGKMDFVIFFFKLLSIHSGCNMFWQKSSQDSAPEIEMIYTYSLQSFIFPIPHQFFMTNQSFMLPKNF